MTTHDHPTGQEASSASGALGAGVDETLVAGLAAGERAYVLLRNAILRGTVAPGQRLSEGELATVLNLSRTPIRSALQMLLQEGLVETGARRQLYVRRFGPSDRREMILLRAALEQIAVAEACRSMDIEELDELRLVLIRQRRAADNNDPSTFIDLDDQFHVGIAVGAKLPTVEKFLTQLRAFIRMMGLLVVTQEGRMRQVLKEHDAILEAIEARDEKVALAALDAHLQRTYDLLEQIGEHPDGQASNGA